MTASRARLRQHVTRIARETGADPLTVLAAYADKLKDHPAALAEIGEEIGECLAGRAYR